jgi:hypothetical protein
LDLTKLKSPKRKGVKKMELLRCKARLAVLWLTMAVGTAASMLLIVVKPGGIEDIMAGEMGGTQISEGTMVIYALFFIIPLVVAILSLTLNGSANRWLNFVLGIVWGLWFVFQMTGHATMEETVPIATWLLLGGGLVISAYIAYFAWKLPEMEA